MLPILLSIRRGPRSYTAQDVVELQCPGNPALVSRILAGLEHAAAAHGLDLRPAEPGEFTARAFLNNRIGLTQAEGVAAAIAAQSEGQLRAARQLRSGVMAEFATDLADQLASSLALIEAGIDFTDQEDVSAISPAELHQIVSDLHQRLAHRLHRSVPAEHLQALPRVVLVGPPNAGKSSLFNALLNRERAVVSCLPGTTRDCLVEPMTVRTSHGDAEILLVDLAGLDSPASELDHQMQAAARAAISSADLIVSCLPADRATGPSRRNAPFDSLFLLPAQTPVIHVLTKSDLESASAPTAAGDAFSSDVIARCIHISARTGQGLQDLLAAIAQAMDARAVSFSADVLALQPRHLAALSKAAEHCAGVIDLLAPQMNQHALTDAELVASELRGALNSIALLAGMVTTEEILGRIFSRFCIGK